MAQAKIEHQGNGVFVDLSPVDPPSGARDPDVHIYAYAEFRSLEHVSYGFILFDGGPHGEQIDQVQVGEYGMEPVAPFQEFKYAIDELESDSKWAFEEVPYVEVLSEEDYNEALEILELDPDEDSAWAGPGLYDFRDSPPTSAGSVEDYELESLEDAADQAIEFMFQGDEWEEAYNELAEADEED